MGISFTRSLVDRLTREIAELETTIRGHQQKRKKTLGKINQLQRDQKLSQSASDLSSKITRENKLRKEIEQMDAELTQMAKALKEKQALLADQKGKSGEA
ncbi:hypothetical protein [Paenibacillus methanolicus]|uniref:Uncharacterized protein n=1 Tax=Paenibacillus methanolicus TaxID=582686 RepID=A0A5S5BRE4_9BACL|nr:hypothetical protein [Paenibacillus methanolicus]TYP69639.1 hypothetical protein BCM02_114156 [Paenibacillus methanolicus]